MPHFVYFGNLLSPGKYDIGGNLIKLSTKGFGKDGLWDPDLDCWGRTGTRTDSTIHRALL